MLAAPTSWKALSRFFSQCFLLIIQSQFIITSKKLFLSPQPLYQITQYCSHQRTYHAPFICLLSTSPTPPTLRFDPDFLYLHFLSQSRNMDPALPHSQTHQSTNPTKAATASQLPPALSFIAGNFPQKFPPKLPLATPASIQCILKQ